MKRALFRGFGASALELAPTLLGAMLVREIDGVRVAGRIVEGRVASRGHHHRRTRNQP